jgi:hypothetical protein
MQKQRLTMIMLRGLNKNFFLSKFLTSKKIEISYVVSQKVYGFGDLDLKGDPLAILSKKALTPLLGFWQRAELTPQIFFLTMCIFGFGLRLAELLVRRRCW